MVVCNSKLILKRRIIFDPSRITRVVIYQYFDKNQKILYVGKAKNLKKRVSSYFTKKQEYAKTKLMVSKIKDIKYFVVPTEMDALLLENNLIKKHQPKYNVMLKDDKTYPFICVKNEPFPRVYSTRKVVKDGSFYFGPYTSVRLVRTLIDFIHQLYPLRTCNFNLKSENIQKKKFKLCLEYHIGNCLAPCEGFQSEDSYQIGINHISQILKGDIKSVVLPLPPLQLLCIVASCYVPIPYVLRALHQ